MEHVSQGGSAKGAKNLLKTRTKGAKLPQVAATVASKEETEVVVLEDVDVGQLASLLKLRQVKSKITDKDLLNTSMEFFLAMDSFLQGVKEMPEARMGLRAPAPQKIDLTQALLAAKELQCTATEYAFSHPLKREQDAIKRQMAAGLAELTESFLFFAHIEKAEEPMIKDRAEVVAGMVVDTKNNLRGLVTKMSMLMVPFEG